MLIRHTLSHARLLYMKTGVKFNTLNTNIKLVYSYLEFTH